MVKANDSDSQSSAGEVCTKVSRKSKDISKKEARTSQSQRLSEKAKTKSENLVKLVTQFRTFKESMNTCLQDLYKMTKVILQNEIDQSNLSSKDQDVKMQDETASTSVATPLKTSQTIVKNSTPIPDKKSSQSSQSESESQSQSQSQSQSSEESEQSQQSEKEPEKTKAPAPAPTPVKPVFKLETPKTAAAQVIKKKKDESESSDESESEEDQVQAIGTRGRLQKSPKSIIQKPSVNGLNYKNLSANYDDSSEDDNQKPTDNKGPSRGRGRGRRRKEDQDGSEERPKKPPTGTAKRGRKPKIARDDDDSEGQILKNLPAPRFDESGNPIKKRGRPAKHVQADTSKSPVKAPVTEAHTSITSQLKASRPNIEDLLQKEVDEKEKQALKNNFGTQKAISPNQNSVSRKQANSSRSSSRQSSQKQKPNKIRNQSSSNSSAGSNSHNSSSSGDSVEAEVI